MTKEPENWVEFGLWVKRKREAKGWTQEELAKPAGFSDRQTIYRIEAGVSTKRSSVINIAKALDESPNEALAIAFGLPKSPESAADLAERKAEIERTAELIENWSEMSPDEQARALAVIKLFRGERPVADPEVGRSTSQPTHKEAPKTKTPTTITRSSARQRDAIDEALDAAMTFGGKPLSEKDRQTVRETVEERMREEIEKQVREEIEKQQHEEPE